MLTLEERLAVVSLYEELGSYRAVATIVGCDHKTVKAHVERSRCGAVVPRVVRRRTTDPYRHLIRERVEQTRGRVRGRRLLKVLRAAGYEASLRTLQRTLREEKRHWHQGQRRSREACAPRRRADPAHLAPVLFDNAKTVTSDFVAGLSVLNPELVRLATHYRLTPVTAAASDPESKGKRPLLRGLVERPPVSSGEARKVDHLSTVRLGAARYSVPRRLRGEQVQVLVDGDEVRVLHRGGEVALHQLQPPGGASIADEHYPSGARGSRPLRPRHRAEVRFLELGEMAERYLRAAAAAGTPRLRLQVERVLELERSHGREAVQNALGRAVEFGRYGHEEVAAILLAGGAAPPARLSLSRPLALAGLPEVPTRQMQNYRWPQ